MTEPKVHLCGFKDCGKMAICGLQNTDAPSVRINVCREHFIKLKGREPKPEEIRQLTLEDTNG